MRNYRFNPVPMTEILMYEISSSPWAKLISIPILQYLAGKYYAWKVKRKYVRYINSLRKRTNIEDTLDANGVQRG